METLIDLFDVVEEKQKELQIEFIRSTKAIYKEKGIDVEILTYGIKEFELVRKNS